MRKYPALRVQTAGKGYMGRKDLTGKDFFGDKERFAELLNIALYGGKGIIRAKELVPIVRRYPSFTGKAEKERDIFMKDTGQNICYGLELETESDYSMPERVMVYDSCELELQIKEICRGRQEKQKQEGQGTQSYREKKSRLEGEDFLLPVVTIVLYLGVNHWEGKRRLSELYRAPENIRSLLNGNFPDYGYQLIEADFVEADGFRTDLKEFFQAMQCRNDKNGLGKLLKAESFQKLKEDTAWAIAVYLDKKQLMDKMEKEGMPMCKALAELMEDKRLEGEKQGVKKGEIEGRKKGKKEERLFIISKMLQEGMDSEVIKKVTNCSQAELAAAGRQ